MAFKKAEREKLWVKVLLTGPSGSGKSYSALRLATGLAKACGSRIAAVDTENGRIRYYADEFDFDDMQIADPFTPEKFVEAIDDAVEGGYKVLILDSSSAEWKYLNEVHDKMPGNSFTNWGKLKPRHAVFMDRILEAPIHIIVTARGKDEYVLEEKNGKQQPKKIGMGAQQEKDIEYNLKGKVAKFGEFLGSTPMTIIIKNGRMVHGYIGSMDTDTLTTFTSLYGVYENAEKILFLGG